MNQKGCIEIVGDLVRPCSARKRLAGVIAAEVGPRNFQGLFSVPAGFDASPYADPGGIRGRESSGVDARGERDPDVGQLARPETDEAPAGDADDTEPAPCEGYAAVEHRRVSGETSRPEGVAQDGHRGLGLVSHPRW